MPIITTLSDRATEESTYVVTASFYDENDDPVTPTTVTWTLTDEDGVVINSREDVSITPGTSVDIVLSGDDLTCGNAAHAARILTVDAMYNSDLGSGLPLKGAVRLIVDGLITE